jgi:hypothetical protein
VRIPVYALVTTAALSLFFTGCTNGSSKVDSATSRHPASSAATTSPSPTPIVTISDGFPADERPLPGLQGSTVADWLSAKWGLKPGSTGRADRHDAATGTDLVVRTTSDREHDLRVLNCAATSTDLGKQFLSSCVSTAIPGADQSAAVSWLNAEFTKTTPLPQNGQGSANQTVGVYRLSMAWSKTGYGITIAASNS